MSVPLPWPACAIPALPPARGFESSAKVELRPRYEDIAQDGRVQLTTLTPGVGAIWDALGASDKLDTFRTQGILPILRRIVIAGERGPFSVHASIHFSGTWRLAREANGDRLLLNMWVEGFAPIGKTLGRPPAADAERVLVGRIFSEHVITRPFAPPQERKVTRLDLPGIPAVPEDVHVFEEAEALLVGRTPTPTKDHVFGMLHTDSNQHVNSLVYPRLFEEAVVRTLATPSLLARAVEIRYRKPFFAGERAEIVVEAAAAPTDGAVAVGAFLPANGEAVPKPSCTIAMRLA